MLPVPAEIARARAVVVLVDVAIVRRVDVVAGRHRCPVRTLGNTPCAVIGLHARNRRALPCLRVADRRGTRNGIRLARRTDRTHAARRVVPRLGVVARATRTRGPVAGVGVLHHAA
ncbi:MAG: hypothetical protein ACK56F_10825, partial [bacterium]